MGQICIIRRKWEELEISIGFPSLHYRRTLKLNSSSLKFETLPDDHDRSLPPLSRSWFASEFTAPQESISDGARIRQVRAG